MYVEIQTDIGELRAFTADLIAEQQQAHPDLLDHRTRERNSIGPDDRPVPEALEMRADIRQRAVAAGYYGVPVHVVAAQPSIDDR